MNSKKTVSDRSMQLLKPFLRANFESGWEIEILYFLYANSKESWTCGQLERNFQIETNCLQKVLTKFCQKGLLDKNPESNTYYYSPDTSEKNALVILMARAFSQKKLQVVRIIYE